MPRAPRNAPGVEIAAADPAAPDVRALIEELDAYLGALYPPESNHLDAPGELQGEHVTFLCARLDGEPAACGALKLLPGAEPSGELKRLYVRPRHRGRGLAKRLLAALERRSRERGVALLRLETGVQQPESLGLYRAMGYRERGPFGDHGADPQSVFMEKRLTGEALGAR